MNDVGEPLAYPTRKPSPSEQLGEGPVTPVLVATSDNNFYLWQVLVQIQHFKELGMLDRVHWLFYHRGPEPSERLQRIQKGTGANFHWWRDRRHQFTYNPAMKPWLVGKALEKMPEIDRFHYLDPDVMLTRIPAYYDHIPAWAGSPTDSYTGPSYLRSHGEGLWQDLCRMAKVSPDTASQTEGAGAQWLVEGSGAAFWYEVAETSVEMYLRCRRQPRQPGQQYAVQAWCAEMYATQLVALAHGFPVDPNPMMLFLWADAPAENWQLGSYFHDAGIPEPNGRDFCKGEHQSSPFGKSLSVSEASASYTYYQLVQRTGEAYPDLIW